MTPLRALLFDLGGVVIHVDFDQALAAWQPHSPWPLERMRELYRQDDAYRRHETGALDSAAYFGHVRSTLGLRCNDDTVREGWNRILCAPIDETLSVIDTVKTQVPCHALSNTNATHLRHMQQHFSPMLKRFDTAFYSHEIGHRKPSAEAFSHVVRALGVQPAEVLFFDDLAENVAAARWFGMHGALVREPADVRKALAQHGLVPQ